SLHNLLFICLIVMEVVVFFSTLSQVRRQGNNLIIHSLISGDRCNGGIAEVSMKDDSLIYGIQPHAL
ncbi:hypothetical protein B1F79_03135, partial [Coxiella-like endosymbiont of Rhipicephalus sanguineus]|nr:hypothetical protein [Coxiella-like endosymbiont of Rhipicephalus sanguineus]